MKFTADDSFREPVHPIFHTTRPWDHHEFRAMLTIRREQMQALNAYMQQSQEHRITRRIVSRYPNQLKALAGSTSSAKQAALGLVRQATAKAEEFGISSISDVAAFLDLQLVLGPDFLGQSEYLWMKKILTSKTIPPAARMRVLFQRIPLRLPEPGNLTYPKEKEI